MILAKATGLGCAHKLSNVENDNNGMLLEMLCIYNERSAIKCLSFEDRNN